MLLVEVKPQRAQLAMRRVEEAQGAPDGKVVEMEENKMDHNGALGEVTVANLPRHG